MTSANERWSLDSSSRYHFREWEDGVTVFLEGENSIFLINEFAAYLLGKFRHGQHSFQELLELVRVDYASDPVDTSVHTPVNINTPIETLAPLLENTLAGLSQRGILIRTRL
ncbi:MAG: hypothetical protein RRB22_01535 [Gammaproteobacteria bacterium]|nr:hypothetical protein [Gammaproteobacteria bacterium]